MANKLIDVDGKLLKALYSHYGMNFDYELGEQFAASLSKYSGADTKLAYHGLIGTLVDYGYAETFTANTGKFRGREQVNLSFGVRDLILYNSGHDWKRWTFWTAIVSLFIVIPVGAAVVINFVLTVAGLNLATRASLDGLILFAYIGLLAVAFLWQDHRRPPKH